LFLTTPDILRLSHSSRQFGFVLSEGSLWRELAQRMVRAAAESYVAAWPDDEAADAGLAETELGAGQSEPCLAKAAFEAEVARRVEATAMEPFELDLRQPLVAYFRVVNSVAVTLAKAVSECKPDRCVVGLDRRCYDVTSFVHEHPGGRDTLLNYHGKDATAAFDVYGHSLTAHTLMRTNFLGFDAVAHCGTICRPPASRVAGRVNAQSAQGSAARRWWGEPWYLQARGGEGRLQMYGGGSGVDADGKRRGLQWWETCVISAVGVLIMTRLLESGSTAVTAIIVLALAERSAGLLLREKTGSGGGSELGNI